MIFFLSLAALKVVLSSGEELSTRRSPRFNQQGWGLRSQFSPFRYFPKFSEWWKHWLPEWYQAHIWQVSPQLSCGDTWQIRTWLKVSNLYFCKIKTSRNGEINERSFSNLHPWNAYINAFCKTRRRFVTHVDKGLLKGLDFKMSLDVYVYPRSRSSCGHPSFLFRCGCFLKGSRVKDLHIQA